MTFLPRLFGRGTPSGPGPGRTAEERTAETIARLTTSRRQVAEAYERERQRIERDLHDGAQQHFVAAAMALGEARLVNTDPAVEAALARAEGFVTSGLESLRETVRGIHPQVLTDTGLAAALSDTARTFGPHVRVHCPHPLPRLESSVLAAAYFFATEALTNAAKHAPEAPVSVLLTADDHLTISVVDQGPGGVRITPGGGVQGMVERMSAFDGAVEIHSPAGGPTQVVARIPMMLHRGESGIGSPHIVVES